MLTGYEEEARELEGAVRRHRLRVRVRAIGSCLTRIETSSTTAPSLVCARELDPTALGLTPIGTPPCLATDDSCPFDPYRLVKLVNARELVYSPTASRILGRLAVTAAELRELVRRPASGAAALLERHREWTAGGEVRVAVMIPASTPREAYDAAALRAAAVLAEQDAERDASVDFKVELLDDGCEATQAFKYLTDAPGAEYGALSGVAGPACGAAFADVARQSPGLRLPVLAYTPQAPPPGASLALLAAGDARQFARAWTALAARLGWRRVSLLSELATRAAVDPADLGLDVVVHVELTADRGDVDFDLITRVRYALIFTFNKIGDKRISQKVHFIFFSSSGLTSHAVSPKRGTHINNSWCVSVTSLSTASESKITRCTKNITRLVSRRILVLLKLFVPSR